MKRARELIVQAGNGTLDQTGLNGIAAEIEQIMEACASSMNGTYAGRYVFSGTATLTPPVPAARDDLRRRRQLDAARDRRRAADRRQPARLGGVQRARARTADTNMLTSAGQRSRPISQSGNRAAPRRRRPERRRRHLDQLSAQPRTRSARAPNRLETQQPSSRTWSSTSRTCCRRPRTPTWRRRWSTSRCSSPSTSRPCSPAPGSSSRRCSTSSR